MLAHIRPFLQWFACKTRPVFNGIVVPGSVSRTIQGPPRAQSPFARLRRYPFRRDVFCITSEGVIPPSSLLRTHAPVHYPPLLFGFPYSMGLCRFSPVPAGYWTFPVLSPQIFPQVSGPLPRWVPMVLSPVSSHGNIGLLQPFTESTFPPLSRKATSHGATFSGLQSFRYVQTPTFARHPGRSYPNSLGSCDFYIRASHDSLPHHAPDMLNVRIGQLTFGDFHPTRSAALPAAPKGFVAHPITNEHWLFVRILNAASGEIVRLILQSKNRRQKPWRAVCSGPDPSGTSPG
jgi:hypothetical protein